jgi:hypothetical protein
MKPLTNHLKASGLGCFFLLLFSIPCLAQSGSKAPSATLWGNLKSGPHRTGYKTIFTHDLSRAVILDAANPEQNPSGHPGRQMQINVWYPAKAGAKARPMRYAEYVQLLSQTLNFGTPDKQKGEAIFVKNASGLGGGAKILEARLPALMQMEVAAIKDAPPAAGRFPLVVFPEYRAPATNSILCEYLASHGFVVASTSMKGTFDVDYDTGLTGMETQIHDLQFIIGLLRRWPNVDGERLGLMGVGVAANACLGVQMRNPLVNAVVSLDGGIISPSEDGTLKRTPYFDPTAVRTPILAIYAPHPSLIPDLLNQYKYSDRYVVHFPKMSEFHFLNYGMLETFVPGVIGRAPGDTKTGFEWASRYVLHFLKAQLEGVPASREFLERSPAGNQVPDGILIASKKTALKAPPTLAELKAMIGRQGVQGVVSLFRQLRQDDPQPFTHEQFLALTNWLTFVSDDPGNKMRKELALLRVESYPQSSRAHFSLAGQAMQANDRELARKHFKQALQWLESDADPALDAALRKRIEQVSRQNLQNLAEKG